MEDEVWLLVRLFIFMYFKLFENLFLFSYRMMMYNFMRKINLLEDNGGDLEGSLYLLLYL